VKVYASKEDLEKCGKNHDFLIMNHSYAIDTIVCLSILDQIGFLGSSKAFIKKSLSYIPGVGWCWRISEFVVLTRSFDEDQKIITRQLTEIFNHPHPVMLLLCPEGTRFTQQKHAASVKFARDRGLAVLNHHLIPRTKGFIASLQVLKKKCSSIVDMQLAFDEKAEHKPTFMNLLRGKPLTAHMYLRRIPMSEVPKDEVEGGKWLQELFVRKDKLQTSFYNTGDFFKESGVAPLKPIQLKQRKRTLIIFFACFAGTVVSFTYFLVSSVFSQSTHFIGMSCFVIFLCKSHCNVRSSIF
jgi:lysophosphatidic acid acyltransferase / lysophosphatidylinositol acyltransferase